MSRIADLTRAEEGLFVKLSRRVAHRKVKEPAMSKQSIIRAWKDEEYRLSLTEAERAALLAGL